MGLDNMVYLHLTHVIQATGLDEMGGHVQNDVQIARFPI